MLTYPSDHSLKKNHFTFCELQELKVDTQLKHVFNKQQERRAHETVALIKINTIFVSIFEFQFNSRQRQVFSLTVLTYLSNSK